jgi:hypothetical protein
MTVEDIIRDYLKKNGYDGLVSGNELCYCPMESLDCEFMTHCRWDSADCEPAYLIPCAEDPDGDHLVTKKYEPGTCPCTERER